MAGWNEILNSVEMSRNLDTQITKYLKQLSNYTGRNVIVYFSGWQQKVGVNANWAIDDYDRNGFMNALKGLDKTKGLDLIMQTPGGDLAATKSIVEYLLAFFNKDVRVIVPHTAMSAGTMIACSAKEIILGLHSTLGPIDPQIGGVPANEYLKLIKEGKEALSQGKDIVYWRDVLSKYPPTFFGQCENAISLSEKYVSTWLKDNMLAGQDEKLAKSTAKYLANYNFHLNHNTRLHIKELQDNTSLVIKKLEDDSKLQDLVLSIFHCYSILVGNAKVAKIIENQNSKKFVISHQ